MSECSSPGKLLGKLKDAASMAISVATGRKLNINKNPNASNIIPGFGYAVMDLFENQYVDMDSISKSKVVIEETKSPFKSPVKKRLTKPFGIGMQSTENSPSPGGNKEANRAKRREERQREIDEREAAEKAPPK